MGAKLSGLEDLDAVLQRAITEAVPEARKIVAKGCLEIKRNAKKIIKAASHRGYLPHYPKSISYDTSVEGTVIRGEIGPEIGRALQAGLGTILEQGTLTSAPIPHMSPALDAEEGPYYSYMEQLGIDLLEGVEAKGAPVVDTE